jgi:hypothetical protein
MPTQSNSNLKTFRKLVQEMVLLQQSNLELKVNLRYHKNKWYRKTKIIWKHSIKMDMRERVSTNNYCLKVR